MENNGVYACVGAGVAEKAVDLSYNQVLLT